MDVTEKWLGEIGGWQAMKAAREFLRAGAVTGVSREGPTFRGLVGSGQRKFRASLTAGGGGNAEARCGCPDAQRGLICAHALAVALAAIAPSPTAPSPSGAVRLGKGEGTAQSRERPSASPDGRIRDEEIPPGEFTVYIATDQIQALADQQAGGMGQRAVSGRKAGPTAAEATVPVFLQFQQGGESKDLVLGRWLLRHGLAVQTTPLRLPLGEFCDLLTTLVGHPGIVAGKPGQRQNGGTDAKTQASWFVRNTLQIRTRCVCLIETQQACFECLESGFFQIQGGTQSWFWSAATRSVAPLPPDLPAEVEAFVSSLVGTGKAERSLRWLAEHLDALCQVLQPETDDDLLNRLHVVPAQPRFRLRLDGNLRRAEAGITALLPDGTEASESAYPVQDAANPLLFYTRNRPAERAATRRLEDAGFVVDGSAGLRARREGESPASLHLELKGEREILRFLSSDLPRLRTQFDVIEGEGWRNATRGLAIIRPKIRPPETAAESAGPGMDWLSLEVAYEAADGFTVPRNEVLRLIRSGKRDVQGRDGRRYLLDADGCEELEEVVQDMESHFESGSRLAVRSRQAEVLEGFIERPEVLALHLCPPLDDAQLKSRLRGLGDLLRPYQLEGVRWMERHTRTRGGGVLADEMGLGKTVQTLATLRILLAGHRAGGTKGGPALVVCPTSLLGNWSEEAARFTPELRTHVSHDSDRHEDLGNLSEFDVVFTSYALIVRDLEFYKPLQLSAVVLDEASFIRNPDTETAKAVRQLRADCRFALTGTPVENSVRDLWSIFEFLMPRCLPPRDDFHERFVKPLSQADPVKVRPVMERLRRLIRPNLLRRTKREVAKDLPEKIEKVLWCDLSGPQRELYQRLLDEGREEIRQARRRAGQGSARMTMFTVLLRLRQVCNDLRLLGIRVPADQSQEPVSGKWPVFEELLQESMNGEHKVLIFSQFVGMLRLVRAKIEALGIPFSYLDGSSQDRAEQVAAFQTDPTKRLFLISLKAGGYGLNLTAADEVVLVDPWWNPAVEAQAIDRAHRIGQGKPVTAYRLVTRGTVEEKILKLQAQKRAVMDMALEDDGAVMSGVSDEELEAMLE